MKTRVRGVDKYRNRNRNSNRDIDNATDFITAKLLEYDDFPSHIKTFRGYSDTEDTQISNKDTT